MTNNTTPWLDEAIAHANAAGFITLTSEFIRYNSRTEDRMTVNGSLLAHEVFHDIAEDSSTVYVAKMAISYGVPNTVFALDEGEEVKVGRWFNGCHVTIGKFKVGNQVQYTYNGSRCVMYQLNRVA